MVGITNISQRVPTLSFCNFSNSFRFQILNTLLGRDKKNKQLQRFIWIIISLILENKNTEQNRFAASHREADSPATSAFVVSEIHFRDQAQFLPTLGSHHVQYIAFVEAHVIKYFMANRVFFLDRMNKDCFVFGGTEHRDTWWLEMGLWRVRGRVPWSRIWGLARLRGYVGDYRSSCIKA